MTTTYTQEDFNNTQLNIVNYMDLIDPKFEGQTRPDDNGDYKMYFSSNNILYGFKMNLFS